MEDHRDMEDHSEMLDLGAASERTQGIPMLWEVESDEDYDMRD